METSGRRFPRSRSACSHGKSSAWSITSLSGFLLFYSQPTRYYGKALFWLKLVLMALAGVNALAFHVTTYRSVARWNTDRITPFGARLAGILSLVLWAGVVVFGRLTAYNWFTYE